jgi:hypothetical protein
MSIPRDCYWTLSDEFEGDTWISGCSQLHSFFEGTPVDNNYHFCPYCGGFLVQQEEEQYRDSYEEDFEEEEEEELLSDDEYYENDRDDENFIAEDD